MSGAEARRLADAHAGREPWYRWGPYLSERQWGTVREDYSADGDGLGVPSRTITPARAPTAGARTACSGICDDQGRLCFALALWNGADPILKERLFGLSGNRGQPRRGRQGGLLLPRRDADPLLPARRCTSIRSAPSRTTTWSPRTRGAAATAPEYELRDTGVFAEDRYFDVAGRVRQGRARRHPDPDHRRPTAGPTRRRSHLLPTLWFRNTWAWGRRPERPELRAAGAGAPVSGCVRSRRPSALGPDAGRATASPSCCSPRTRPTRSGCAACRTATPLRQGRHQRRGRPRRCRRRQPGRRRAPRPRSTTGSCSRPGESRTVHLRLAPAVDAQPFRCRRRAVRRAGAPRPTSSTRASAPRP